MIIGNSSIFALESEITHKYRRQHVLASGYFVIHVAGKSYGVCKADATMLGCSYDEVCNRIRNRNLHTAPFSEMKAEEIANAFRNAIYSDARRESYFGIAASDFVKYFYQSDTRIQWAPDGDEAFDDGSYVLQFDIDDRVRVIAFKSGKGWEPNLDNISEVWLKSNEFYKILQMWVDWFENELKNIQDVTN